MLASTLAPWKTKKYEQLLERDGQWEEFQSTVALLRAQNQ